LGQKRFKLTWGQLVDATKDEEGLIVLEAQLVNLGYDLALKSLVVKRAFACENYCGIRYLLV
jgi:hypothetical protein